MLFSESSVARKSSVILAFQFSPSFRRFLLHFFQNCLFFLAVLLLSLRGAREAVERRCLAGRSGAQGTESRVCPKTATDSVASRKTGVASAQTAKKMKKPKRCFDDRTKNDFETENNHKNVPFSLLG